MFCNAFDEVEEGFVNTEKLFSDFEDDFQGKYTETIKHAACNCRNGRSNGL